MKVLVVGGGGREHSICWAVNKNSKVKEIYCTPGNAGIAQIAKCINIKTEDIKGLVNFANSKKVDLTIIGPEAPLVNGIVGEFQKKKLNIIGPSMMAAEIEGSKVFAKEFMKKFNIPTADYEVYDNVDEAKSCIKARKKPFVIKVDGLAAGKGVFIPSSKEEAFTILEDILLKKMFGEAGKKVIIEDKLEGEEATMLALTDGSVIVPLESSQDHKRLLDYDLGPNTGGMGAYSPNPLMSDEIQKKVFDDILVPTMNGLRDVGRPYKGVLYVGLMITSDGPKVLEFNVRWGDPEAQVVIPRMKSDFIELMFAILHEELKITPIKWSSQHTLCVVIASSGYPSAPQKGKEIYGLSDVLKIDDIVVFHSGTQFVEDKTIVMGGRVLGITGFGDTLKEAMVRAYLGVNKIKFDGMHYRKDIGAKGLKRSKNVG